MRGESVEVYRRESISIDALGEPEYIWSKEQVNNVLVRTVNDSSNLDIDDPERPDGLRVQYTLAFPKTYISDLTHCKIALIERGMTFDDALNVLGSPDYMKPCPTAWNRIVSVGRTDG